MTAMDGTSPAELMTRLDALALSLEADLVEDAEVERDLLSDGRITMISITPKRPGTLGVSWLLMGTGEVILQAGHQGGRWELAVTSAEVDLLEDITRSVIAGRVVEIFAWRRSRVEVTLSDGTVARESGRFGFLALIPLPFWPQWGRRVKYDPYH